MTEGHVSELWNFTHISVTQNNLQELKEVNLVPTVEEYRTLLRCLRLQADKAYSRVASVLTFLKKLMSITGMRFDLGTSEYEEKGRCLCLEYLQMAILQTLEDEVIEWRTHWMIPDGILYRCRDFDWVTLLGIWGATGYALLLVLRQYRSKQFIPVTQGLAQYEFVYKSDNYKNKVHELLNA
ncbi:hypothetical protein Goshw_008644 [Gossypium schwendimanii]|uniref:Uncharacterized protein n=1 Tax=Gossypium schwendimanii TaxID=34291 RepID=A0A7J9MSA7_GOSSC|nr:hypothetical protein [Gossypium schwendimanii]